MKTKLACPVCSRQEIEEDIYPNCETNLSLVRMLTELPPQPEITQLPAQPKTKINWLMVALILGLLVALIGWFNASNVKNEVVSTSQSVIVKQEENEPIPTQETELETVAVIEEQTEKPETLVTTSTSCKKNGFYYKVRRGDSLSMMALNFYGDANLWPTIATVNPIMEKQNNLLEIGQVLLVPNLEENCNGFFQ